MVAGRRATEGEATIRLVQNTGSRGLFVQTDITQEVEVKAMIDQTISAFGRLDFAFNNAGTFGESSSLIEQTQDQYDRIMDVIPI